MKEMMVDSIMLDLVNKTPVVILKEVNGDRYLPILIGEYEASAIQMGLKNISFPRPMTHDLLQHILDKLQIPVEFILISRIEDSTFFASIIMYNEGEKFEVDARPSDAIALALRTKCPILVNEEIIEKAGIPMRLMRREGRMEAEKIEDPETQFGTMQKRSAEEVTKFRDFINNVTPEDFFRDMDEGEDFEPDTN